MDQMKILMLVWWSASEQFGKLSNRPHPLPDRKPLESQVLRVLENKVRERKDCPKPVELVYREVVRLTDETSYERIRHRPKGCLHTLCPVLRTDQV